MRLHLLCLLAAGILPGAAQTLDTAALRVQFEPKTAAVTLIDKSTGAKWTLRAPEVVLSDSKTAPAVPQGPSRRAGNAIEYTTASGIDFRIAVQGNAIDYSFTPKSENVARVDLLSRSFPVGPAPNTYYAVPQRMGVLLLPEGEKPFTRILWPYGEDSMAMFGAVQNGSALLASWDDVYTDITVNYSGAPEKQLAASLNYWVQGPADRGYVIDEGRRETAGFAPRHATRSVRIQLLGKGGYVEIAKAYRVIAKQRGYLKTIAEKLRENPKLERLFGAADFKPFLFERLVPNTRWNKSNQTKYIRNFSFEESAQLAEHFRNDLGIDRAMFVMAGWINGGYDNRHPDILPAAPEIGGNSAMASAAARVRSAGYVFGLHDNYQDMYKDAPSWDPSYIMKKADGSLLGGWDWAGGMAYLICSQKSLALARRNVPQVRELFAPDLYFSDTIFASPIYECFDKQHPISRADDIKHKLELSDYLRKTIGLFGSEEGREWGVAHADYFEGLISHRTHFQRPNDKDIIIPLFELVYGDCIPIYSHQSDRPRPDSPEYILAHILYAEMPVYGFGSHLYWKDPQSDYKPKAGAESKLVFARGAGKYGLYDQFIKNTYEILSPLNRVTALMEMTDHRFLTPDRQVEFTRFGKDVEITANFGEKEYRIGNTILPQYGFLRPKPGT